MNHFRVLVVCCLFLQLTFGVSLPLSRREDTRSRFDDLRQKLGVPKTGRSTTVSEQLTVPTIIRYSTFHIEGLAQDEETWFVAKLCGGNTVGKAINVTMVLNNNLGWEPVKGVVNFAVIDSFFQGGVLCTNKDSNGDATPHCLIESWPNEHNIIILAKAGPVSGIALSLAVEIFEQGSPAALQVKANIPSRALPTILSLMKGFDPLSLPPYPIPLTETVSVFPAVSLAYQQQAIIKFSMCSNTEAHVFSVSSTVTSADGESSFAQYICDTLPCDVGLNNIAHNGEQQASNVIATDPIVNSDLYVVVVNWGGAYDEDSETYVGNFMYHAKQDKIA
ncbi:uncharacterized protein LOC119720790 [Patiria miniata]|uniref:Uncharacterized protein n=1 Tax=Patiria miniata TaxID=46514 RepID=A0A913Z404_PATMI|nr:uncharacterized protein LOC119720790 [Patiria miniata]